MKHRTPHTTHYSPITTGYINTLEEKKTAKKNLLKEWRQKAENA